MSEKVRQTRITSYIRRSTRGQTLVIVAMLLGLGVLIGLVAIAFDGGSALLQRRAMQNGADAGAQAGVDYMADTILITCAGGTCRPTYGITNAQLRARVEQFVAANREGTIGTPVYSTRIEYHYMAGALVGSPPSAPCADCYVDAPTGNVIMPEFVDGLRVTAIIDNPTTFAGAIPNPISQVRVSAVGASRLFPTCPPAPSSTDPTVPFTRLRPALERQIRQSGEGNTYCQPFLFWNSTSDLGGRNRDLKNAVSYNTRSFFPQTGITNPNGNCGGGEQQLLTEFDCRNGASPPAPPPLTGGLLNHTTATNWTPFISQNPLLYNVCSAEPCADLRGRGTSEGASMQTDVENWIAWQWRGRIGTTNTYPASTMTWYPSTADRINDFGRGGRSSARTGDWAEALYGNLGNNINDSLTDSAHFFGRETAFSPPVANGGLGWGKAVFTTVYVWGVPEPPAGTCSGNRAYCDDTSAQDSASYTINLPGGGTQVVYGWQDLEVQSSSPTASFQARRARGTAEADEMRLRFTKSYSVVFYENIQGSCGGCIPFPGCGTLPSASSSEVYGFILNRHVSDPPPGSGCPTGWNVGDGVYTRQIEP
jgi:hypothetical protein